MVYPVHKNLLISLVVTLLLVVKSTRGHEIEDEAMLQIKDLTHQLGEILKKNMENDVKISFLESTNAESKIRIDNLEAKIGRLEERSSEKLAKLDLLEATNAEQDKAITKLKTKIFSSPVNPITPGFSKKGIPSSCSELAKRGHSSDGLYLVKNHGTKKIETVFCNFGPPVFQKLIGNIDVKTKSALFNVVRNSSFGALNAVIPFEMARLNEGGAMNISSGIFTAPVSGIYHFEFSGLKHQDSSFVSIFLVVNGAPAHEHAGTAYTDQVYEGTHNSVSFTTLIRLKANDRVNLFNDNGGILYDSPKSHHTQFIGVLVDEDLI